jgi:streptogramin lyase
MVGLAQKKIETIAGSGKSGYAADHIGNPYGLTIGPDGALYICEIDNHVVRRLDLKTGKLTTVAGNARRGYSGDGGPATAASLNEPYEIRFDKNGNMFFVEMKNHVVRRVDARTGVISTVAGTGQAGFGGDGGPAKAALLNQPHSIQFDPAGNLLICDIQNQRIRVVDMKTGTIATWAGTGEKKPTPDGAPLQGTPLWGPRAIDFDAKGNAYLALREGNKVFRIDMTTRTLQHLAGSGEKGYCGGSRAGEDGQAERSEGRGMVARWRVVSCRYREPHDSPD